MAITNYGESTMECIRGSVSTVYVKCNPKVPQGRVLSLKKVDYCQIEVYMESRHACPQGRLVSWEQAAGLQIASMITIIVVLLILISIVLLVVVAMKKKRPQITLRP